MKWFDRLVHWIRCIISEEYRDTWHMSAAEYNKWLCDRLHARQDAVCKRLETILPKAWSDYVTKCKMEGDVVFEHFVIHRGDYGLSSEDMADLYDQLFSVGKYHVTGKYNHYTGKWYLSVTAPEFRNK